MTNPATHDVIIVDHIDALGESILQSVELMTDEWQVQPLAVESVRASYFETRLAEEAVTFDNALLMDGIGHQWDPRPSKPISSVSI